MAIWPAVPIIFHALLLCNHLPAGCMPKTLESSGALPLLSPVLTHTFMYIFFSVRFEAVKLNLYLYLLSLPLPQHSLTMQVCVLLFPVSNFSEQYGFAVMTGITLRSFHHPLHLLKERKNKQSPAFICFVFSVIVQVRYFE